ncbi:MAG TPA: transposase [Methylothermaceae bacterium]|nr:transposase [Methylothermaceae bacterium]
MTQPRSSHVSLDDTPWYHCVSRCVRRAFLCGEDAVTGKSFEHRRGWIAERIKQLAGVFAIDVAAYAVMSNHYHVVVRIDRERALGWSVEEVLRRWTALFSGPLLVQKYLSGARGEMGEAEIAQVEELAEIYRQRLYDLSWFMRTLNEYIARKANAEDGVKGRFWEGRFKSQALLDEPALLAAMAYVDLNPLRAGMAETPEASDYTSIQERIGSIPKGAETDEGSTPPAADPAPQTDDSPLPEDRVQALPQALLLPFDATGRTPWAIPFDFQDYLELVDWTGRAIRDDKRGAIPAHQPKILVRLGIDGEAFIAHAERLLRRFGTAVGAPSSLINLCARRQSRYLRGIRTARRLFQSQQAA